MAAGTLDALGEDHASWLLVAAHNELLQRRGERAAALLDLLRMIEPGNVQCRKMLAYACWLDGDQDRAAALANDVLLEPLAAADRAAMEMLRRGATSGEA
ncbi:MAG: hypothetical protein F4029_00425 [Gammaproteobacteria bacterium]|nr:hypothetical protein [Gammaproteobacteria bacterium]MXY55907.1 hypothetical protein [Gammaproteobacteria bacterium]MYF30152.1 hypothetical protein [Gammaproteobacteria bacterium]MYK44675.1 hypothetical protein [Gammaproteobacteria bacterium]